MRGQTTLDFAVGVSIFLVVVAFVVAFVPTMLEPFEQSAQEETAVADRLADQLATDLLAENVSEPYVLDRECTVVFFESREDGNDPGGDDAENVDGDTPPSYTDPFDTGFDGPCGFADIPFRDRLGLDAGDPDVRIRLVADLTDPTLDDPDGAEADPNNDVPDVLCIDDNTEDRIVEAEDPFDGGTECDLTSGDDDIAFTIGETPPTNRASVVVARRVVSFEGGFGDGNTDATLVVEVW